MSELDPMGDNDPLVIQALQELWEAIGPDDTNRKVQAIDGLIQARLTCMLESLADAAMGKLSQQVK